MPDNDIDRVLNAAVADGRVAGVVALAADRSGTFYQGAFGQRGLDDPTPMLMDTVFWIASMTKAVTGVAAMQCVEQGKLSLDQSAGEIMPELAEPSVLEGFDAAGKPILRPARRKITLRSLLTHTAGFVYEVWNANQKRYVETGELPALGTRKLASLNAPLAFEPGERWEYGINIDWAGRMVEAVSGQDLDAYMREHIFEPLGMRDTGFVPSKEQVARGARNHLRKPDGSLQQAVTNRFVQGEYFGGGGALFSTGPDYMAFLRMLLNGGSLNGASILQPATVVLMMQNHIGDLDVQKLATVNPAMSNDAHLFPDMKTKWGLTWLINTEDVSGRRSAGSVAWAGVYNTYYWLDPKRQVAGALLTQVLPFADPTVLTLLDEFETAVYRSVT